MGWVEREALDRARERMVARRATYYRRLEDIAELDRLGVAQHTGERTTERLVQDLWRIDLAEARRLVAESDDLTPRTSLQGQPLPPRLPCTAGVLAAGRIGPAHVAIIRKTMTRLGNLDTLSAADLGAAERILAQNAALLPPRALDKVAQKPLHELDPDGVAPPEGEDRFDELHLVRRKDGSLALRGRIHDPLHAEIIFEVFDALSTPAGPDDDRSKPCRHAAALTDLAQNALGEHGVATDTRHETTPPQNHTDPDTEATNDTAPEATAKPAPEAADEAADEGEDGRQGALIPEPRRREPSPRPGASREPAAASGRALLSITIDHQWLRQATGHGTLDSGALVDVRTGGCAWPGCTRRPRRCHAHHVDPHWIDGGHTSLGN